jgi:hypothetical protein
MPDFEPGYDPSHFPVARLGDATFTDDCICRRLQNLHTVRQIRLRPNSDALRGIEVAVSQRDSGDDARRASASLSPRLRQHSVTAI